MFSIPLLKNVKQTYYGDAAVQAGVGRHAQSVAHHEGHRPDKGLLLYLVAYFFYIDGVGTVINLATTTARRWASARPG